MGDSVQSIVNKFILSHLWNIKGWISMANKSVRKSAGLMAQALIPSYELSDFRIFPVLD